MLRLGSLHMLAFMEQFWAMRARFFALKGVPLALAKFAPLRRLRLLESLAVSRPLRFAVHFVGRFGGLTSRSGLRGCWKEGASIGHPGSLHLRWRRGGRPRVVPRTPFLW